MTSKKQRAVAWWLVAGVVIIILQTLLGGVTRLTGSGLSITKWNPIFGILPPLNAKQWNDAFEGYKQIGQFKFMNAAYSLEDFKGIFFWEWLHRFCARMLGIVFAIGFAFFLIRGYFDRRMIRPFVILFLLGGLQGLFGWLMVHSGLNDEHVYVDHVWLAIHFVSAMILACYTLWFALQLLIPDEKRLADRKLHYGTLGILVLLFIQLTWGAFMAGLKAAMAAPSWPKINNDWVPPGMLSHSFISDRLNVHFVHRGIAYVLVVLLVWWFVKALQSAKRSSSELLRKASRWPVLLVILQVTLGIFTVLTADTIVARHFGTFELLAEMHQMVAMFLLMALVVNFYVIRKPNVSNSLL